MTIAQESEDDEGQKMLARAIEAAVTEHCKLAGSGLLFCVNRVEVGDGSWQRVGVHATLHFLNKKAAYCCREPGCHLGLSLQRRACICENVRSRLELPQLLSIEFESPIPVRVHTGVTFKRVD